ncbi:uncharacterized protein SPPG_06661 [Spizellomyces punctatus DAOM BR117]|uniref:SH3 domain-containing protein n=1 Tax=Spizellomyces punctatus (strain DAOM BR117) TaxID=645134 RepID=A0A0L0HBX8_SPIPD|nr:uncharacterized protein SPPG_06661 [Spizellomyces punctatus DAOM BR117]KNC98263.1 hypothetical protein SPPG_06661 [Spizellomyces punctatus DAOM BR117]|eukprot:XP_016606303.1 hypothetical protein SPPG_06661 [Spizellomyces punctatus DAOM BR117]
MDSDLLATTEAAPDPFSLIEVVTATRPVAVTLEAIPTSLLFTATTNWDFSSSSASTDVTTTAPPVSSSLGASITLFENSSVLATEGGPSSSPTLESSSSSTYYWSFPNSGVSPTSSSVFTTESKTSSSPTIKSSSSSTYNWSSLATEVSPTSTESDISTASVTSAIDITSVPTPKSAPTSSLQGIMSTIQPAIPPTAPPTSETPPLTTEDPGTSPTNPENPWSPGGTSPPSSSGNSPVASEVPSGSGWPTSTNGGGAQVPGRSESAASVPIVLQSSPTISGDLVTGVSQLSPSAVITPTSSIPAATPSPTSLSECYNQCSQRFGMTQNTRGQLLSCRLACQAAWGISSTRWNVASTWWSTQSTPTPPTNSWPNSGEPGGSSGNGASSPVVSGVSDLGGSPSLTYPIAASSTAAAVVPPLLPPQQVTVVQPGPTVVDPGPTITPPPTDSGSNHLGALLGGIIGGAVGAAVLTSIAVVTGLKAMRARRAAGGHSNYPGRVEMNVPLAANKFDPGRPPAGPEGRSSATMLHIPPGEISSRPSTPSLGGGDNIDRVPSSVRIHPPSDTGSTHLSPPSRVTSTMGDSHTVDIDSANIGAGNVEEDLHESLDFPPPYEDVAGHILGPGLFAAGASSSGHESVSDRSSSRYDQSLSPTPLTRLESRPTVSTTSSSKATGLSPMSSIPSPSSSSVGSPAAIPSSKASAFSQQSAAASAASSASNPSVFIAQNIPTKTGEFLPTSADEIPLRNGDTVTILESFQDGWCRVRNWSRGDVIGMVPKMFLAPAPVPRGKGGQSGLGYADPFIPG